MSFETKPTPPPLPDISQVPEELRNLKRWCGWKAVWDENKKKWRKPPHSPVSGEGIGAVEKWAAHWLTFEAALAGVKKHGLDGVGFVFVEADGYVGIDFDDCRQDGKNHHVVDSWLRWLPTYAEISPSGTGVHAIGKAKIAKSLTATVLPNADDAKVEIYNQGRYFTFTGKQISKDSKIGDFQAGVDKLLSYLGGGQEPEKSSKEPSNSTAFTRDWVRDLYQEKLNELRACPEQSGNGNSLLNKVALIVARVCASGVLDKTKKQFKQELLNVVTKEWLKPHEEHSAYQTIESGWAKGESEGPYLLEPEIATVRELSRPDMPDTVLCGILGRWCRERLGDFPIAFAWPSVLASASARVKSDKGARCNLYVCLVGPVHFGKSQAGDRSSYLFNLEAEGLVLTEKVGSAEGLLERLGDRNGQGVLWYPDELSHVLEKAQIQNASFPTILNSMFYHDRNDATVAHRKHISCNARMSLLGGIVEEKFGDVFGAATTSGFYDRCLFGLFPTGNFKYVYRPMEGPPLFDLVQVAGDSMFDLGTTTGPRVVVPVIDKSVWDARDEVSRTENIDSRILELAIRVALICAAWDEKDVLRASDLGPAWELARYQQRVRSILQPNPGRNFEAMAAHKILNYVKDYGSSDKWLEWRTVCRATHIMDFGPSVAERAVRELIFARELEEAQVKPTRGPKKRLIRILKD